MERIMNKCPVCAGKLVYSSLMQFSLDYGIKRNGELSTRAKKSDVSPMECGFISCTNPKCDFLTNCDLECENYPEISIYQQNGAFYYDVTE